eukprot:jgi/Galph1/3743/GphlegSOOS_G2433.1
MESKYPSKVDLRNRLHLLQTNATSDHNQAMSRALGTAMALSTFEQFQTSEYKYWREYIENVWDDWLEEEDTCENAPSYNAIYLWCLLMLTEHFPEKLNHLKTSAKAKSVFARFRDQISPSCNTIPKYGDDGGPGNLFYRSADAWPAIFERAGSIFQDNTFRWAAATMFLGQKNIKHHPTRQPQLLLMLSMTNIWRQYGTLFYEAPSSIGSIILTRRKDVIPSDYKSELADKVILCARRQQKTPFVMFEVFARGHHSHFHPGSLIWYDDGEHAFFTGLGHHNSHRYHSNSLTISNDRPNLYWENNSKMFENWNFFKFPTVLLKPHTSRNLKLRQIRQITYRFQNPSNTQMHLQLARVQLEGPAGILTLEHFEDPHYRMKHARVADFEGYITGNRPSKMLDILVAPGVSFNTTDSNYTKAPTNICVDIEEYKYFTFWWRTQFEDQEMDIKPQNFLLRTSDAVYDVSPLSTKFLLHFDWDKATTSHNVQGDQFCCFCYTQYVDENFDFTRQAILLIEGILFVVDRLSCRHLNEQRKKASIIWHVLGNQINQTGVQNHLDDLRTVKSSWAEIKGFPSFTESGRSTIDEESRLLFLTATVDRQTINLTEPAFWGVSPKTITITQELDTLTREYVFVSLFCPCKRNLDVQNVLKNLVWKQVSAEIVLVQLRIPRSEQRVQLCLQPKASMSPTWSVHRDT